MAPKPADYLSSALIFIAAALALANGEYVAAAILIAAWFIAFGFRRS